MEPPPDVGLQHIGMIKDMITSQDQIKQYEFRMDTAHDEIFPYGNKTVDHIVTILLSDKLSDENGPFEARDGEDKFIRVSKKTI